MLRGMPSVAGTSEDCGRAPVDTPGNKRLPAAIVDVNRPEKIDWAGYYVLAFVKVPCSSADSSRRAQPKGALARAGSPLYVTEAVRRLDFRGAGAVPGASRPMEGRFSRMICAT